VDQLIKEVTIIEFACQGKGALKSNEAKDDFQARKAELHKLLSGVKDDIKVFHDLEDRQGGKSARSVELKYGIERKIKEAHELQTQLEDAYQKDQSRFDRNKKDALDEEEIKDRKEIFELLQQDLKYTECQFKPEEPQSGGFALAREGKSRRQRKREEGSAADEPIPLTEKQQVFIQESIQRDAQLDEKLDVILEGVKQLGQIAFDIQEEFQKQDVMLSEIEQKMDDVQAKLESRNEQVKKLLDATGGAQRWCPVLILCVILVALVGYVYNLGTN